jgi:hypothetical protein
MSALGVLSFIFGVWTLGWFDYAEVAASDGSGTVLPVCVAIRCFHILSLPVCPLSPVLIIRPSPSFVACRGEHHVAHFASTCNKYLWRGFGWAWLRWLCFGLLACCYPRCEDPVALMSALSVVPGAAGAASAATAPVVDNKAASGYGTTADNTEREQQQSGGVYAAVP